MISYKLTHLNIAGFIIEIKFKIIGKSHFKNNLDKDISKYFYRYIIEKGKRAKDYAIDIIDKKIQSFDYIRKKDNINSQNFIQFYERVGESKLTTYSYISIDLFYNLINQVLENLIIREGGFMFQGMAIFFDNEAHLLINGKKNINIFKKNLKNKFSPILSEETFIVKKEKRLFYLYKPPVMSTKRVFIKDTNYKLRKIYHLKRSNEVKEKIITNKEYLNSLLLKKIKLPRNIRNLEYNQYSLKCYKNVFQFIKSQKFYNISSKLLENICQNKFLTIN